MNPLQVRTLELVASSEAGLSTTMLAREMEVSVGKLAHHVRRLAQGGLIEVSGTARRRGATETFYRIAA